MTRKVGKAKELGIGYDGKTAVKGDPYKAMAKSLRRKSVFAATVAAALGSTSAIAMDAHGAMWAKPAPPFVVYDEAAEVSPEMFVRAE